PAPPPPPELAHHIHRNEPTEFVVAAGKAKLDERGEYVVTFDTPEPTEADGDSCHHYRVVADVTDHSRRTLRGEGRLLAARRPFEVHVWLDRGHYRLGDEIGAHVQAQTINGRPI